MGLANNLKASFPPKPTFTEKECPNQAGKVRCFHVALYCIHVVGRQRDYGPILGMAGRIDNSYLIAMELSTLANYAHGIERLLLFFSG